MGIFPIVFHAKIRAVLVHPRVGLCQEATLRWFNVPLFLPLPLPHPTCRGRTELLYLYSTGYRCTKVHFNRVHLYRVPGTVRCLYPCDVFQVPRTMKKKSVERLQSEMNVVRVCVCHVKARKTKKRRQNSVLPMLLHNSCRPPVLIYIWCKMSTCQLSLSLS